MKEIEGHELGSILYDAYEKDQDDTHGILIETPFVITVDEEGKINGYKEISDIHTYEGYSYATYSGDTMKKKYVKQDYKPKHNEIIIREFPLMVYLDRMGMITGYREPIEIKEYFGYILKK